MKRSAGSFLATNIESKRWLKANVYNKAPLFLRALLYFLFRYFTQMSFRDGKERLIIYVLQGFWYRFLVNAKLFEYRKAHRNEGMEEVKEKQSDFAR